MIAGLVSERRERRDLAIADVSSKWGNSQTIVGPALALPYASHSMEAGPNGQQVARTDWRAAIVLPERLRARGVIESEVRSRGIFPVPVYRLKLTIEGDFGRVRPADLGIAAADVGSIELFIAIAAVMRLTRRIDWYSPERTLTRQAR